MRLTRRGDRLMLFVVVPACTLAAAFMFALADALLTAWWQR